MLIDDIRKANKKITIYTTDDPVFANYGRIVSNIDAKELMGAAEKIAYPEEGSLYQPSCPELEGRNAAREISDLIFGTLDTEIGYCRGYNSYLGALEWHSNSEVNIAVTDFILLLAKRSELRDGTLSSSDISAFYVRAGEIIEIYSSTLHFCPCQVKAEGFGCIVALPRGTNLPLDCKTRDNYLFRKNKWLIAHKENRALTDKGVMPGIFGENIEIKY